MGCGVTRDPDYTDHEYERNVMNEKPCWYIHRVTCEVCEGVIRPDPVLEVQCGKFKTLAEHDGCPSCFGTRERRYDDLERAARAVLDCFKAVGGTGALYMETGGIETEQRLLALRKLLPPVTPTE